MVGITWRYAWNHQKYFWKKSSNFLTCEYKICTRWYNIPKKKLGYFPLAMRDGWRSINSTWMFKTALCINRLFVNWSTKYHFLITEEIPVSYMLTKMEHFLVLERGSYEVCKKNEMGRGMPPTPPLLNHYLYMLYYGYIHIVSKTNKKAFNLLKLGKSSQNYLLGDFDLQTSRSVI